MSRSWQPTALARFRAAVTVKPVIRGTWHDVRADATATLEVPVSVKGRKKNKPRTANHEPRYRLTNPTYLANTTTHWSVTLRNVGAEA